MSKRSQGPGSPTSRALRLEREIELEKLRFEIACLKRMKYGRSSEQLDHQIAQMEFTLEDLEATLAATPEPLPRLRGKRAIKPGATSLPAHLPREEIASRECLQPARSAAGPASPWGRCRARCSSTCRGATRSSGTCAPSSPARACQKDRAGEPRPAVRSPADWPVPRFLAHVLVSKYADHLPLYRQSQIYAREGIDSGSLDARRLGRRGERLARAAGEVAWAARDGAAKLHGDDTPVPVLLSRTGQDQAGAAVDLCAG